MAFSFGSVIDDVITGGKGRDAEDSAQNAVKAWRDAKVPEFADYDPELFKYLGDFNPYLADAGGDVVYEGQDARLADIATAGRSEMDNISVDPRLKDQQMESLAALDAIASGGGMTMADKAALAQIESEVGQADRGRRDAIKQNMAQRGMGGSGMELLQMLDSSQAATDRAAQGGLNLAGMAQQRALDAILQGGNMAGNVRGQDFGEQAQIAEANDVISKFNAQNLNQGNQFNVGNQNQMTQFNANNALQNAQFNRDANTANNQFNAGVQNQAGMLNTQNRQSTADANTALNNQAQMQNKFVNPQQTFQNQAQKAAGKSGAHTQASNMYSDLRNQDITNFREMKKNEDSNARSMTGGILAMSDERVKKDVKNVNDGQIDEFLSAIDPKKFKYKNPEKPGQGPGEKVGFMLQDVEHTDLGKDLVKKNKDGELMYDQQTLNGIIMAILAAKK